MIERLIERECDLIELKLSGLFVDTELAAVRAAINAT